MFISNMSMFFLAKIEMVSNATKYIINPRGGGVVAVNPTSK